MGRKNSGLKYADISAPTAPAGTKIVGYQVLRDGKVVHVINGDNYNEAFYWLLKHQGQSVSYALTYGGYSIEAIYKEA